MQLKFKPAVIIFDMDGVIVDSMPYHFIAWYEALRPWGIRVNCFDVYAKEGEKWERSLRDFLIRGGQKPTPTTLRAILKTREKIFKKYFRRFLFKGAPEFICCLKEKGYVLALVTGTSTREIHHILPKKVLECFSVVVAGDKVKNGKPHPEPYLTAAKRLGVDPSKCVVIENAPYGITSAKRAGMYCIAITTSLPEEYLKHADTVVNGLNDITGIIEHACLVGKKNINSK